MPNIFENPIQENKQETLQERAINLAASQETKEILQKISNSSLEEMFKIIEQNDFKITKIELVRDPDTNQEKLEVTRNTGPIQGEGIKIGTIENKVTIELVKKD